jgi:hypothetical protein
MDRYRNEALENPELLDSTYFRSMVLNGVGDLRPDIYAANQNFTSSSFDYQDDQTVALGIRAFDYLENQCGTREAKKSLREFRYMYAQKKNEPRLMPKSDSLSTLRRVGRVLSGSLKVSEKHSTQGYEKLGD